MNDTSNTNITDDQNNNDNNDAEVARLCISVWRNEKSRPSFRRPHEPSGLQSQSTPTARVEQPS